jgi:hypothetical protein
MGVLVAALMAVSGRGVVAFAEPHTIMPCAVYMHWDIFQVLVVVESFF